LNDIRERRRKLKRYSNKCGKPRSLSARGKSSEFYQLVYELNQHVNPATVLKELVRRRIVEEKGNAVRLVGSFFECPGR